MTKRQLKEYKYGNAVRALMGGHKTPPEKEAQRRVNRWEFRLQLAGIPLPTVIIRRRPRKMA